MKERSERYLDGDFVIEGVIANHLYQHPVFGAEKKPSADELDQLFMGAVRECREMGLTDEEIRWSIGLNLRTYNFDDETFPIDRWMSESLG